MVFRGDDIASWIRRRREFLAVIALLAVALALRLYQYDWDQGHLYHPDERFILMSSAAITLSWPPDFSTLFTAQSTLIPRDYSFSYGTLSLYLVRLVQALLVQLNHLIPSLHLLDEVSDLGFMRAVGRPISALFDTATVYLVYRLGRVLYGKRAAYLAAIFVTFSVIDLQLSHFYATDTIMTALVIAAIAASASYLQGGRTSWAVWAGVFAGLALATKASAATVLAPVVFAHVLRLFVRDDAHGETRVKVVSSADVEHAVQIGVFSVAAGVLAFAIAEPFAIIDFQRFINGVVEQSSMVRGVADLPYTRQYFDRPAYLYFLQNLIVFGAGAPLGIAMVVGFLATCFRNIRRARAGELLLLSYVIPYFAITGDFWAKFLRYMLPISPLLSLMAAYLLVQIIDVVRGWRQTAIVMSADESETEAGAIRLPPELVTESYGEQFDEADLTAFDGELVEVSGERAVGLVSFESQPVLTQSITLEASSLEPAVVRTSSSVEVGVANGKNGSADGFAPDQMLDWEEFVPNGRPDGEGGFPAYARLPAWVAGSRLGGWLTGPWAIRVGLGLVAVIVAFTVFYGVAFVNMYDSTTPPVEASQWLYANAAKGSVIATEHWEERMPVPIPIANGVETSESHNFRNVTMPMYEDDNAAKLKTVIDNVVAADYIVFFSNRLYGTVPRIPDRYPMSQRYYQKLFGEQLGFTLVEASARYPNLFGIAFVDDTLADPGLPTPLLLTQQRPAPITINLGHADESFSVYDHQKVLIFQKTQKLTPDELRALIGPPAPPGTIAATVQTPVYKSLLLTPAQEAIVQAGGTFHDLFDRTNVLNQVPLLTWIVLIALIGLAGVPLGFYVFRFLPDRGYLVAKTLGVLVLVWLSWMAVSLGLVTATRWEALGIFLVFLALGAITGYRQRREIAAFWREHQRLIMLEEGLFWIAFLFDVYVRSLNPDLWHPSLGGEKPMDLAYFTAATKSATYPPYDPWFAGGYLNYYYFGQVIVGTLTRLSGVLPTTSYNIVVPLLFALTVAGAFTAAFALIHRTGRRPRSVELAGAVLASLMVCVLGNIGGFFQLMSGIVQQSPPATAARLPLIGPAVGLLTSIGGIVIGKVHLNIPPDWYWSSTRALSLLDLKGGTGSINEFPYFTFLFADLHAHLIALPFTLLAIALAVNVVKSAAPRSSDLSAGQEGVLPAYGDDDLGRVRWGLAPRLAALVTMGLVVGALYPTNSWDYPTYLGLIGVALAIPWYLSDRRTTWGFVGVLVQFALVVVLSQLLYRPFASNFQSFYSGVHLSDEKSDVRWYFVINGLFIVIMITYFGIEAWQRVRLAGPTRLVRLYVGKWELLPRTLQLQRLLVRSQADGSVKKAGYVAVGALLLVALSVATGMSLVGGLLILLVAALALALRREQSAEECLMVFLFATGLAISIGTEIVAIDGDVGRMNTIFKFYEQIWVLFGVAGAVAVVRINQRLGLIGTPTVRGGISAVLIVFFVMAAVYPLVATGARVSQRFSTDIPPTLDGTAFMDRAVYADTDDATHRTAQLHFSTDKAMIQWIQDNISGTPAILEGNRPLYRWGSRVAIYTGLPTVIGWDWHQKQQRSGFQNQIDDRLADVKRMYDDPSTDATMSLLRKYDVSYIIDGELEVGFYPTARTKFDSMVGQYLSVAYDQSGVRIYQVK